LFFGKCTDTLSHTDEEEVQRFIDAFEYCQVMLAIRSRLGMFGTLYWTPHFKRECKTIHSYIDKLVSQASHSHNAEIDPKAASADSDESSEGHKTRKRYIFLRQLMQQVRDPKWLRSELLNILLAGRDTTSSVLSSTFYILASNPGIRSKVQEEVNAYGSKQPTFDTMREMKYLRNVLREGKRDSVCLGCVDQGSDIKLVQYYVSSPPCLSTPEWPQRTQHSPEVVDWMEVVRCLWQRET
jgi:cytochrome P450